MRLRQKLFNAGGVLQIAEEPGERETVNPYPANVDNRVS
jgi:hypothetical protein